MSRLCFIKATGIAIKTEPAKVMLNKITQYQLLSPSKGLMRINAQLNTAELTRLYAKHLRKKEASVAFLDGFSVSIKAKPRESG